MSSFRRLLGFLFLASISAFPALAQNENETVGFQTNHIFESGQFGENIDVLNGGLNLTIPIGPKYQVSQHLGYQLLLTYGSKVWDTTRPNQDATLFRLGNAGLGFSLHFGRIYRDVEKHDTSAECTWYYVSPDGNEHELPVASGAGACVDAPIGFTIDNTHYSIGGAALITTWSGDPAAAPTLSMTTPDGTLYTMGRFVQVYNGPGAPLNSAIDVGADDAGLVTNYNRDFGGWYVTRITNVRSGTANKIDITYDARPGYEHLISSISDSTGRSISFTNDCQAAATASGCAESFALPAPNALNRPSTRIGSITVPAFRGNTTVDNSVNATYNFNYAFLDVPKLTVFGTTGPVNFLTRIDYPTFSNHAYPSGIPPSQRYTLTFGYTNGELVTRTLPTGAVVTYEWSVYKYLPAVPTAQPRRIAPGAFTRCVTTKTLTVDGRSFDWTYRREAELGGTIYTNPKYVIVKDPLGNETVHLYRASRPATPPPTDPSITILPSRDTEDGYAPEWNDGVNYQVEYYQGNGSSRKLVRTETRDYDADLWSGDHRDKKNVRMNRTVTIFNDDEGRRSTVAYRDWDGRGHYRVMVESGDGIEGARTTRTEYFSYDPGQFHYREVSDGQRVLSRVDNNYDAERRLVLSIERAKVPATIGTPRSLVAQPGDIRTEYFYDGNGKLFVKKITDAGDGGPVKYQIRYGWQAGGYLATKEFSSNPALDQYYGWLAIDRSRDGNTGLIYLSRDTAGIQAGYKYDALGRLTDIIPRSTTGLLPASTEFSTQVEYVDIRHTTVRQGDPAVMGSDFSCANAAGNYIMTCYEYDDLGRLTRTEKRSDNPAVWTAYQKTFYDILGRSIFQSEWIRRDAGQSYCARPDPGNPPPNPCSGTTFDYSDPGSPAQFDPFGRVRRVQTADGKETFTDYFGNSSRVRVAGIQGLGASGQPCSYDATTTYFRDGWGRLVYVEAPVATCGGAAVGGGADAAYTYDLRDNLIHVEMVDDTALPLSMQTRSFEYDALNRIRSSYNPESGTQVVTGYDTLGNITETKDASGNRFISTYDGAGRLVKVERRDYQQPGAPTPPLVILQENTYDQDPAEFGQSGGRLTTVVTKDDAGAVIHTRKLYYAGLNGRLSSEKNLYSGWPVTASAPVDLQYNDFGLVNRITYPQGLAGGIGAFAVTYTYANGYATEVWDPTQPGQAQARVAYNAAGGFQEITTYGNSQTTIQPDVRHRPSKITIGKGTYYPATDSYLGGTYYQSGAYQYDGAGNIYGIGSNQYGYDAASRLVGAVDVYESVTRKQTYSYDDFGNMTQKDQYDAAGNLTSRDLFTVRDQTTGLNRNRILNHQYGSTLNEFTYDARGNLWQGDAQAYEVDSRNRMIALRSFASGQGTEVARYAYDGAANRLRKEDLDRGITTFYVRDGQGRLLSEFRRTNRGTYTPEWAKHYIFLGDRLVGLRESLNPSPPGPLTARTSSVSQTVTLDWKAAPQGEGVTVTGYKVSRSPYTTPPTWTVLGTTTLLTFTDTTSTGLTMNTLYRYVVGTLDSAGRESFGQDEIVVLAGDPSRPSTPVGLAATPGDRRVDLAWSPNPPGEYVVGYHVYRRVDGRNPPEAPTRITAVPVAGTSFADQGLANGSTYLYSLTAVDSATLESTTRTAEVSVQPGDYTPPGAPLRLLASAGCSGGSTITVSWEPNPTTDGVSSYLLFREPVWSGPTASKPVAATTYTDSETLAGTTYAYWAQALDLKGNASEPSLKASVRTRDPAGTVPVPAMPYAQSGDGRVTLRIPVPVGYSSIGAVRVYRKPNVDTSCGGFERVGETSRSGWCVTGLPCPCPVGQSCLGNTCSTNQACSTNADCQAGQSCSSFWGSSGYVDFTDGTAPNNVAYDYAVTNVENTDRESAFSATALGIPVGRPINYSECVEELPSLNYDGAIDCPSGDHPHAYRRVVVRWSQPQARPYQPFSDHADGTLGYLKGYRVYRHLHNGSQPSEDRSSLTPINADYDKRFCHFNPDVVCQSDGWVNFNCATLGKYCNTSGQECTLQACPSGAGACIDDYCQERPDGTAHDGYGQCSSDARKCMVDSDCASGSTCQSAPADPSLLLYEEGGLNKGYRQDFNGSDCLAAKAVYKIFANGTWLTVESDFSENFNVTQKADPASRCIQRTVDACAMVSPPNPQAQPCPSASAVPPVPPLPTVESTTPGTIRVSWGPASLPGLCELASPAGCPSGVECPAGQFCSQTDENKCRLSSPTSCSTSAGCPASPPQICSLNTAGDISGWRLYVVEQNTGNPLLNEQSPARYHYLRPAVALTFDASTRSHIFTGLSNELRAGIPNLYRFRVAVIDKQGRVSAVSPVSAQVAPMASADPIRPPTSVKAIIWTINDASKDHRLGGDTLSYPNPRNLDGIKISWRDGHAKSPADPNLKGYRVWRGTAPGGPYCALLKLGTKQNPNPPGVTVCTDELSGTVGDANAYSAEFTTGPTGGNRVYVDKTVRQATEYYYAVTVVFSSGESGRSPETRGKSLGHLSQPLSPPAYFKALTPDGTNEWRGIYLRWCANNAAEGVTGFHVYRSQQPKGPYTRLTSMLTPLSPTCLDAGHRCEVGSGGVVTETVGSCVPGIGGTCEIIDTTVTQADGSQTLENQIANFVYYYVVTAVRSSGGTTLESAYSVENAGWPNYCAGCSTRYDPDNFPDFRCGDEEASLTHDLPPLAHAGALQEGGADQGAENQAPVADSWADPLASYRIIGQIICDDCGGGGGDPPPPPTFRFVYFHLDHLGSPRVITDASGNVVSKHHYMPFGEEMPWVAQGSTNKRHFTGHERDQESGLDYMLARYYASSLARFMAVDPGDDTALENPQSWNKFAYARNNPIKFIDPDGEVIFSTTEAASAYGVARAYLVTSAMGAEVVAQFEALSGANEPTLGLGSVQNYDALSNSITWDSHGGEQTAGTGGEAGLDGGTIQSPALGLLHEMSHANQRNNNFAQFAQDVSTGVNNYPNAEERRATEGPEAQAARELGEPTRGSYASSRVPTGGPTSRQPNSQNGRWHGGTRGGSGKGSFFSSGSQPHRTSSGGYVDADGTHWSGARSVEAF